MCTYLGEAFPENLLHDNLVNDIITSAGSYIYTHSDKDKSCVNYIAETDNTIIILKVFIDH